MDLRSDQPIDIGAFEGDHSLLFVGPIHPKRIREALPEGAEFWQTLGVYNVVLHTRGHDEERLVAFAEEQSVRYESWTIRDGEVRRHSFAPQLSEKSGWQKPVVRILNANYANELTEAIKEFTPLAASAIARATQVLPEMVPELESLVAGVAEAIADTSDPPRPETTYEVLAHLTNINAALSRQTSQAFSGTSPISETESHYWTHSLLGTGTANLALWMLANFILGKLGEQRLPQRLAALHGVTDLPEPRLERLDDLDSFWTDPDHIAEVKLTAAERREPLLPVVTCYSGRDGYKSTLQTLSAPLAVIGSCNSVRWTLLTLTHEVSHIIIRGVLAQLYPKLNKNDIVRASELIGRDPSNLLEAVQRYLLTSVVAMHQIDMHLTEVDCSPPNLPPILNRWFREVEEIMVHVFDFLYFYGADADKYVRGIWLSWSVIPNIGHRIPEYVVRTLCAALVLHLRRGPQMETLARDQVVQILRDLQDKGDGGEYVDQALQYIDEHWDDIRRRLFARRNVVRLVRKFLFSERLAAEFRRETNLTGGASGRGGYGFRVGEFDDTAIDQPLRFVGEYTTATRPSVLDSMWMLTLLAFNTGIVEA